MILDENFDIWTKFRFLTKILIFDQNFDFRIKFWFLIKMSIYKKIKVTFLVKNWFRKVRFSHHAIYNLITKLKHLKSNLDVWLSYKYSRSSGISCCKEYGIQQETFFLYDAYHLILDFWGKKYYIFSNLNWIMFFHTKRNFFGNILFFMIDFLDGDDVGGGNGIIIMFFLCYLNKILFRPII